MIEALIIFKFVFLNFSQKWLKQGTVRKRLKIKDGEKIPLSKINKAISRLKKMKNRRNRSAAFVCSLSLKYPKGKIVTVTGKITGSISHKILGSRGFGYDPIFVPRSKSITFGQMSKVQKIRIDHRYIAFRKMKRKIKIF